jgi:hypothetical protein
MLQLIKDLRQGKYEGEEAVQKRAEVQTMLAKCRALDLEFLGKLQ